MTEIRPATDCDVAAISRLTTDLSREYIAPDCTAEGSQRLLESMDSAATKSRFEGGFRHYVAVDGNAIVGVVVTRDERHLFHLYVATSHQRRGLARRLWDTARTACLAAGNPGEFTVNSSRFARPVYERFGFVAQPETTVNGVPFIPMQLRLSADALPPGISPQNAVAASPTAT